MKRALAVAVAAVAALAMACGNSDTGTSTGAEEQGSVKFNVTSIVGGDLMATIVVRNVFDHSLMYIVDCSAKDHTQVGGEAFCDELLVLPPGVYEVIVQSHIEGCVSELDHYKVVVQPNETTELQVKFICGEANGGLDTVVEVEQKPVITDIDFHFLNGDIANKFVCEEAPGSDLNDTVVTITVWDSDTPCADLAADAQWLYNGLNSPTPPFVAGTATMVDLSGTPIDPLDPSKGNYPNYTCQFSNVIDAGSPAGDYNITFELDTYGAEFTFPIHVIPCEPLTP